MWTYMMAAARGDRANSMMAARRRNEVESPKYGYNFSRPMYRSMRLNNGPTSQQNCQTSTLGSSYPYTTSTSHHHYGGVGTTTSSSSGYSQQLQQHHHQQQQHQPNHVVGIDDVYTNPVTSEAFEMEDGTSLFSPLTPTSTTMAADTAVLIARKHMMNRNRGQNTSGGACIGDGGGAGGGCSDFGAGADEQNCFVGSQASVVRLPPRRTASTSTSAYYNESDEDDGGAGAGDDYGHVVKCSDTVTKPATLVIDHKRRIRRHHENQEEIDEFFDGDDNDSLDDDDADDDDDINDENEANYNENVIENGKKLSQENTTKTQHVVQKVAFYMEMDKPEGGCYQTRYFVTFMLFLGMANAYVMRTNMSVAIVAMVNNTAVTETSYEEMQTECPSVNLTAISIKQDGEYVWSTQLQGYILASFFYGYVLTQIPFGMLAKRYGALKFLGYGMLMNSVLAFLVPLTTQWYGVLGLCAIRFMQGLGEGPIVPCTHALLAKWIPPNERSRMGAAVYAGAQFGTIISMPVSGILAEYGCAGGWPCIFYVSGLVGTIWCICFLIWIYEEPNAHPSMDDEEKLYINQAIWGTQEKRQAEIPYKSIMKALPFYGILFAHIAQNYGYETLLTELPSYMKQILRFSLKSNGFYSSLPYLAMWLFSMALSLLADWMITSQRFSLTSTRKIMNSIGQYGPALALTAASFTGCDRVLTLIILTLGVGLNGAIYSGFKINHLDIAPHFAGILMAITNCTANLIGLLAPIASGHLVHNEPTIVNWRNVFLVAAFIYFVGATAYLMCGKATRQEWDNLENDDKDLRDRKI